MESVKKLSPGLAAAALWAAVGFISTWNFRHDPKLTSICTTLVRVLVNLGFVMIVHLIIRKRSGLPWGNRPAQLWLWGFLGAATITSFFVSVHSIGIGQATLLQGTQGILVTLLAPRVLREQSSAIAIIGAAMGMGGLLLLFGKNFGIGPGQAWGLFSGLAAGFAYLVLAREKGRHTPETVSFYWCLASLMVVAIFLVTYGTELPEKRTTLVVLILGGMVASLAQWLTTYAYQKASAPFVSAANYLIPAISFLFEYIAFGKEVGSRTMGAAALLFCSGFLLPLLGMYFAKSGDPKMPYIEAS